MIGIFVWCMSTKQGLIGSLRFLDFSRGALYVLIAGMKSVKTKSMIIDCLITLSNLFLSNSFIHLHNFALALPNQKVETCLKNAVGSPEEQLPREDLRELWANKSVAFQCFQPSLGKDIHYYLGNYV